MINASSETAAIRPAFRDAFLNRRCLVPADGFYEWVPTAKVKQPYCFELNDGELFAFAGLWERCKDPRGLTLVTHNTREFGRVPKLSIEDWTTVP